MTLKPIGTIHSPFKQKFGTPRQSGLVPAAEALIELDPIRVPPGSLEGLGSFSHIWLIFSFHKNNTININGKVHPPRLEGEKTGLLATRSPHRPNPIGMSLVKVVSVDAQNNQIKVSGVDLIHQTPILDIKPYIQAYDFAEPTGQAWPEQLKPKKLTVRWAHSNLKMGLSKNTIELIEQSLSFDLRNREDKVKLDSGKLHKSYLSIYDVHFRYEENTVFIEAINKV